MTNAELATLLREAREFVDLCALSSGFPHVYNLRKRIDAALAQAQPAEGFQACEFCKGSGTAPVKKAWSPKSVLGED